MTHTKTRRPIILLFIMFSENSIASENVGADSLRWMIGQIVTTQTGAIHQGLTEGDFFSTGFIFKTSSKVFFITTAHTLDGFWRKYGHDQPIFVFLPNVPAGVRNIYKAVYLFTEPTEDAAVLKIE